MNNLKYVPSARILVVSRSCGKRAFRARMLLASLHFRCGNLRETQNL